MSTFKNIICSISLIEHSEDIVYYTRELAKQNDAKIFVVHSLPSMDHLRSFVSDTEVAKGVFDQAEEGAKKFLDKFITENFEGLDCEGFVTVGNPANELLILADKLCADVIIMGSMSTKGFFNFFNSRASQSVIGKTRIPVMVVPNDLDMECTPED